MGRKPITETSTATNGFEANFGPEHSETFLRDLHPDLRDDYVLANTPFNDSDTALHASAFFQTGGRLQVMAERHDKFRKDDDVLWQCGVLPKGKVSEMFCLDQCICERIEFN
jgi:type I restriction enzyme M protein